MRAPSVAAVASAALLLAPAAAPADAPKVGTTPVPVTDLADGTGLTAPSAHRGTVVASRAVPGGWELVAKTPDGPLKALPGVPRRSVPFDADAGPDTRGRTVVVFSRCRTEGEMAGALPTVDRSDARGCSLHVAPADGSAPPRRLALRGARGLSLTTPSIWRGQIAAAAGPTPARRTARVLLWRDVDRAPRRLHGGTPAGATRCVAACSTAPSASVDALDLGPRTVAFLWRLTNATVGIGPAVEARWSPLDGGRGNQSTAALGYISGACGFRQPLGVSALRSRPGLRTVLAQSACAELATTFATFGPRGADRRLLRPDGYLA
ncbi:MAG TPA: hypothetical protein VN238_02925, partial [Solirubrobacteraceae bacterium]|nr:hypothetical protein [Solirubrobacteraceae bacterium]